MKRIGHPLCLGVVAVIGWLASQPSADAVMQDFYAAKDRAEDMLMDPLILHSRVVRERVVQEVADPKMPKRRYAIGFLGIDGRPEALPALCRILESADEIDYFRADALSAIWQIKKKEAVQRASAYASRDDLLGRFAKEITAGVHQPYIRSYWQAMIGAHE
jgi:HEAT repeat protein